MGEEKKVQKGGDKYKEGNQTPLSSVALVSTNKYHPLPARDGGGFQKSSVWDGGLSFLSALLRFLLQ